MHYADGAGRDTEDRHHGNGQAEQLDGTDYGMTTPSTVLVTVLDNGTMVLQGRPDRPRVYLSPSDTASHKRELAAVFLPTELRLCGDQDDAR